MDSEPGSGESILAWKPEPSSKEVPEPARGRHYHGARWALLSLPAVGVLALTGALLLEALPNPAPAGDQYVGVYLTDIPGNFEKLEVRLGGVYVGGDLYPLKLGAAALDLAAHRGPDQSILVAGGFVPHGDTSQISLLLESARGFRNGAWQSVPVPEPWLVVEHDFSLPASGSNLLLLDINLDQSIRPAAVGYELAPVVEKVYAYHDGAQPSDAPESAAVESAMESPPPFSEAEAKAPLMQALRKSLDHEASSGSTSATSKSSVPVSLATGSSLPVRLGESSEASGETSKASSSSSAAGSSTSSSSSSSSGTSSSGTVSTTYKTPGPGPILTTGISPTSVSVATKPVSTTARQTAVSSTASDCVGCETA